MNIKESAVVAKKASIILANCTSDLKDKALIEISKALFERQEEIIKANKKDIEISIKENLSDPLLKLLKFDEDKIDDVTRGIKSLINLPDPVEKL